MIKKNDFIEVSYTGKTKEENFVFDTTEETVAKEAGIYNPEGKYGTLIICVGQHHLLPGLDKFVEGKDLGNFTVELPPEEAFGKKNAKLIQLIPTSKFNQQRIQPQVGLQVTIDGHLGVIKTVTGGRTLVDFNHPLSGKNVLYEISIKKKITDQKNFCYSIKKKHTRTYQRTNEQRNQRTYPLSRSHVGKQSLNRTLSYEKLPWNPTLDRKKQPMHPNSSFSSAQPSKIK